ncbi:hypothetical protein F3Y22_tig00112343pilonHSYRG00169 [Hibiscus syriacus]|uniref:Uncharacterized protein n=1 Tax=Hibiscus syriacus TaxID=106335 RepID=A0A6A2YBE9_HIBSY|nr:hypothetical protein F3Y22_tig00112343pilonHSYRG00169 [Hibiscus syriacus]
MENNKDNLLLGIGDFNHYALASTRCTSFVIMEMSSSLILCTGKAGKESTAMPATGANSDGIPPSMCGVVRCFTVILGGTRCSNIISTRIPFRGTLLDARANVHVWFRPKNGLNGQTGFWEFAYNWSS